MEKLPNVEKVQCYLVEGPSCRIVDEEVVKALKLSETGKAAELSMRRSRRHVTREWNGSLTCVMTS